MSVVMMSNPSFKEKSQTFRKQSEKTRRKQLKSVRQTLKSISNDERKRIDDIGKSHREFFKQVFQDDDDEEDIILINPKKSGDVIDAYFEE
jgi:lipoate-protein ligase A